MISRSSINGKYPVRRLGALVEFLDSRRKPVTESDRKAGAYPYFGANGQQGTIDDFLFDEPLVLLAEDGGHFETPERGIAYRIRGKTWVNNHAHVLRPKQEICLDYLCRVLENYDVSPFVTGTTRGKLTKGGAEQIPIPLPPLPEQRRIAAILDKADDLRAKRRTVLERLSSLTQAMFFEMFGDPATNPSGWTMVPIGDLLESASYGTSEKAGDVGALPILRMGNVTASGDIDRTNLKFIDLKESDFERYTVRVGDVLFNRTNSPDLVGKTAIVRSSTPTAFAGYLIRLRTNAECHPEYLSAFLNTAYAKRVLRGMCKAIIGMANINATEIQRMDIPKPTLSLQQTFARAVAGIEHQKDVHRAAVLMNDSLFSALQHQAFAGEL